MHPPKTQTNKIWPLPENYQSLATESERKQARLNACSDISTPDAAVASWRFFREYYLCPDDTDDFDPCFYEGELKPLAPVHSMYVRWQFQHRHMLIGFPRKSGKTTTKRSMFIWLLVTQKGFKIASFQSVEKFVIDEAEVLKFQFEENERLAKDFGDLRPKKGTGVWNNHTLLLNNRSSWKGFAIDGKSRGVRADLVNFDDVEDDDEVEGQVSEKRLNQITNKILKVAVPMLKSQKSHIVIQGTIVGRASFLWRKGVTNEDERFKRVEEGGRWFKLILAAEDDAGANIWKEQYTKEFLQELREMLGDAGYEQEMRNNPRAEGATPFSIFPVDHEYDFIGDGNEWQFEPLASQGKIRYHVITRSDQGTKIASPRIYDSAQFLNNMTRAIAVDYAPTQNVTSDYSAVSVGGVDADGCLWALDGWHGKVRSAELTQRIWDLAVKWRVHHIYIEAVSVQWEIYQQIKEFCEKMGNQIDFHPIVVPVKYPARFSKVDRIMGLESRFNKGLVKFPVWKRNSGFMGELYNQIRLFTTDLKNLTHDDVLDAFAILNWKITGKRGVTELIEPKRTVYDRLMQGERFVPGSRIPWASALDLNSLTEQQLEDIITMHRQQEPLSWNIQDDDQEPGIELSPSFGGMYA